jgi:hypothetical protein
MTYLLTNHYGGKAITCARHETATRKYLLSDWQKAGTDAACPLCEREMQKIMQPWRVFQALTSPKLSHTRAGSRIMRDSVLIYHYDARSPSGVMLAAGYDEKKFDAMFDACRAAGLVRSSASPLSPTEPR